MAILSKNTTIGGKIPLTTDVKIAPEYIMGLAAVTMSGNIDANDLTSPGNYNFKNVSYVNNFPENITVEYLNSTGASVVVLVNNEQKYTQFFINETYIKGTYQ